MKKVTVYSKVALLKETDSAKRPSILKSMAAKDKDAGTTPGSEGTEIILHSFTTNEDAVVPSDEEIVSVEHDRQMGITRIVTKRSYDADRSAKEREEREGPSATPTYPQPAGGVPAPPEPPVTAFAWGSIDTSKVQNQPTVAAMPPTIAAQEADTAQAPNPEALVDEVKANDAIDQDKTTPEAAAEGSNPEDSETLKAAAELAEDKSEDK